LVEREHKREHLAEFFVQALVVEADCREQIAAQRNADARSDHHSPGQRGLWLKIKCLNREEFVVIGWTDPEGSRPFIGALLLGYYDPSGRLVYAGRVGSGMRADQLKDVLLRLQLLRIDRMPLGIAPPRSAQSTEIT